MKKQRPLVGVGVFVRNENFEFLAAIRKNSHGAGQWSLPGGHLEYGESFEKCCKREVFEETGLRIRNVRKLGFFSNDVFHRKGKHYVTLFFIADIKKGAQPKNLEPHKQGPWRWMTAAKLPRNTFGPLKQAAKFFSNADPIAAFEQIGDVFVNEDAAKRIKV